MSDRGVSAEDMAQARAETLRGMSMVLTACQKQLDNLYKDTMLDVSTDIDVLEQMLRRDGYTTSMPEAATATAQQMSTAATPQMAAPQSRASDEDFVSFYSRNRQK